MAVGRITWGVLAYLAPRANARVLGAARHTTPETVYLTRVFGGRALALGLGYLCGDADSRRLWRRLGLVVDVADTAAGVVHLVRGDVPRRAAAVLTLATGSYALIGAAGLMRSPLARLRPHQRWCTRSRMRRL